MWKNTQKIQQDQIIRYPNCYAFQILSIGLCKVLKSKNLTQQLGRSEIIIAFRFS